MEICSCHGWEIWGESLGVPEAWDERGYQGSIHVTLVKTPKSGDIESEEVISCSLAGPQWKDKDPNPHWKIPTQNVSCLKEMQGQRCSRDWRNGQLITILTCEPSHGQAQSLILLMMSCYACTQKYSISVNWKALSSSWLKQTQIPTAKHWTEVGNSYGNVGKTEGLQRMGTLQEDQQYCQLLNSGGSQKLNH